MSKQMNDFPLYYVIRQVHISSGDLKHCLLKIFKYFAPILFSTLFLFIPNSIFYFYFYFALNIFILNST